MEFSIDQSATGALGKGHEIKEAWCLVSGGDCEKLRVQALRCTMGIFSVQWLLLVFFVVLSISFIWFNWNCRQSK